MSNIDKQLDEILADRMWFIEQELNAGQNTRDVLINAKNELEDKIKQLIVDEFEKMIAKSEVVIDSTFNMSSKKGKK